MAIPASTVWEVRPGGNDANGGNYSGVGVGNDYSQQDAAQYALSGMTTSGVSATIALASASTDMDGNGLQITGGTNFITGFYSVISVVAGVSITVDRNCTTGAGAAGTGNLGGGLATVAQAGSAMVAGNTCYVKYGTYTTTSATALNLVGTSANFIRFIGYDTNRSVTNSDANKPLLTTATNSTTLINLNACAFLSFKNMMFSNTAGTRGTGVGNVTTASPSVFFDNCSFDGFTTGILSSNLSAGTITAYSVYGCEFKNCTTAGVSRGGGGTITAYFCWFHDNAIAISIPLSASVVVLACCCIISGNTRGIYYANTGATHDLRLFNNTFYGNTTSSVESAATSNVGQYQVVNNVFYGGADGVKFASSLYASTGRIFIRNNAYGGQSGAARVNWNVGEGDITLTADPTTNGAGNNFLPNSTSGGGALLRAANFPTTFLGGPTSYGDVGAVQHQDSGGGVAGGSFAFIA